MVNQFPFYIMRLLFVSGEFSIFLAKQSKFIFLHFSVILLLATFIRCFTVYS